jgi:putative ABC transport system ATP-binding protein
VSELSVREASRLRLSELGFIRQSFDLLPGVSALDNAVLKLLRAKRWSAAQREVQPLLERLGLGERLHHRSETLSMGERQRVMIAQALATEPRLVLADEPTANLDSRRSRDVLQRLARMCRSRNTAVLLATHDPQAVAFADVAYEIDDGRLHDYNPEEIYLQPGEAAATELD